MAWDSTKAACPFIPNISKLFLPSDYWEKEFFQNTSMMTPLEEQWIESMNAGVLNFSTRLPSKLCLIFHLVHMFSTLTQPISVCMGITIILIQISIQLRSPTGTLKICDGT